MNAGNRTLVGPGERAWIVGIGVILLVCGAARGATAQNVEPTATKAAEPLAILERLVGTWLAQGLWEDPTRGGLRVEYERALQGKLLKGYSYTVDAGVARLVYETSMYYHPGEDKIVFRSVSAGGVLYDGTVGELDADTLEFHWTDYGPGTARKWRQTLRFVDPDTYEWEVFAATEEGWRSAFRSIFHRECDLRKQAADRRVTAEAMIAGSPEQVWQRWATQEGVTSFFAPAARIELRPGGVYELYFLPDADEGSRGSEGCHVLAFEPGRFLAFEWNAPPSLPNVRKERTHVLLTFEAVGAAWTHVRLVQHGWGMGDEWERCYEYFSRVWPVVLEKCRTVCAQALEGAGSAPLDTWRHDDGVLMRPMADPARIEFELVIPARASEVWLTLHTLMAGAEVLTALEPELLVGRTPVNPTHLLLFTLAPAGHGATLVRRTVEREGDAPWSGEEVAQLMRAGAEELRLLRKRSTASN